MKKKKTIKIKTDKILNIHSQIIFNIMAIYLDEIADQICENLRKGKTRFYAAKQSGINTDIFYKWFYNKDGNTQKFREMVKDAEDEFHERMKKVAEKQLFKLFKKDYRAVIWYLENRHNEEYGKVIKNNTEKNGILITFNSEKEMDKFNARIIKEKND